MDMDTFQALVAGLKVQSRNEESWCVSSNAVESNLSLYVNSVEKVEVAEILKAQREDEDIRVLMEIVGKRQAEKDVDGSLVTGDVKLMLRERKRLYLDDKGILRRRSDSHAQIVLPKSMRHLIYQQLHVEFGHLGVERVYQLARQRVYWPRMLADIDDFIHNAADASLRSQFTSNLFPLFRVLSPAHPWNWLLLISCIWKRVLVGMNTSCSLLTTSRGMVKHMQRVIRKLSLRLSTYLVILYLSLGC